MTCQMWRHFQWNSFILPKMSENFWSKEIPLWWFLDSTLKLNNSRTAWPIPAIYILFSSILNALSYEINLFSRCSSPLNWNAFHVIGACKGTSLSIPNRTSNGGIDFSLQSREFKVCIVCTISFERLEVSPWTFTVPVQLSPFHYLTAS